MLLLDKLVHQCRSAPYRMEASCQRREQQLLKHDLRDCLQYEQTDRQRNLGMRAYNRITDLRKQKGVRSGETDLLAGTLLCRTRDSLLC